MNDDIFTLGDAVELVCSDGATFAGVLQDWTPQYAIVNGLGFPWADVRELHRA